MTGLPPELLSAVLAALSDDAPRLACADWLDEHGDADAAAFVRLQVRELRRGELRLSTVEIGRLQREAKALAGANERRWVLEPLGLADGRGVTPQWRGGFVVGLGVSSLCKTPLSEILPRLGAFPLLERLDLRPRVPLPVSALAALPALPRLADFALHAPGPELDDAAVAALAAQPALERGCLQFGPAGRRAYHFVPEADWARVRAAQAARLAATPSERLADELGPFALRVARSRGGAVWLDLSGPGSAALADGAALSRLPNLATLSLYLPAVPAWLAGQPGLVGLSLLNLERFDPAPLAGLRELRYVHVAAGDLSNRDRAALSAWLESLPRLTSLRIDVPWICRARLAGLRALGHMLATPHIDAPDLVESPGSPGSAEPGPAQSFDGVTIRPPARFRLVPPRAGEGVLATWSEWGDGDPRDRLAATGPAWATLERLPFRVERGDIGRVLAAPPGEHASPGYWEGGRLKPPHAHGRCPFAEHLRFLWPGKRATMRLRLECPYGRLTHFAAVARAFADSLEWDA